MQYESTSIISRRTRITLIKYTNVIGSLKRIVFHFISVFLLLFSVNSAASAFAAETIVGQWVETSLKIDESTAIIPSSILIRPMAMGVGEDFGCDFKDVSRSGNVVTWHGTCTNFGESEGTKATVVASLSGRLLTVKLNGRLLSVYRRYNRLPIE